MIMLEGLLPLISKLKQLVINHYTITARERFSSLCALRNKSSQNIKRQLFDHKTDITISLLRRFGVLSEIAD